MLVLLEQELIERYDVETKVCPVLIDLTAPDSNDDVKTEAVAVSNSNTKSHSIKLAWMLDVVVMVVCFQDTHPCVIKEKKLYCYP